MVRRLKESDLDRAAEIHVFSWRTAYAGLIPEDFLYKEIGFSNSRKGAEKHVGGDNFHVVEDKDILRGIVIHGKGRASEDSELYEIYAIYIEPQFIRKGYGEQLLKYVESHASELNHSKLVIYAMETNINARKFYEKNGYITDGSVIYNEKFNIKEVKYIKSL